MNNLLSNAVKFTEEGKIVLSMTLEGQDTDMLLVKVSVLDTGIGIEKGKIDLIFDNRRTNLSRESILHSSSFAHVDWRDWVRIEHFQATRPFNGGVT